MNKTSFFRKAIVWLLITLTANPAFMAPAFARDTDIFLNTTSGSTTAEPNVMIVLDTSDSMNYFEDWHEYPGAYDSHVEYLWNDLTVIGNGATPQPTESGSTIASGVGPTVSSITRAGNVATVTFASNHGYSVGWTVNVYNATDPLYNGSFVIASLPAANKITYTMTATPAANAVAVATKLLYASSRNSSPSSVYGFWGGATNAPEDRIAMWTAAKAYANATETAGIGDAGNRSVFRNYNDGSWLYWTTAGITSRRLRSVSLNRFRGHVQTVGGVRGGVNFGGTANDFRSNNKCNDSGNAPAADVASNTNATGKSSVIDASDGVTPQGLTPSTIFAPSSAPRNSGRYTGQDWVRWERFLNLRNGRFNNNDTDYNGAIPFSSTNIGAFTIAGGSGTGNAGSSITIRNDHAVSPITAPAVRDSVPNQPAYGNGTNNIGSTGLPIRTRIDKGTVGTVDAGDSYSGWTLPKADLGGAQFNSIITSAPYTNAFTPTGVTSTAGGNFAYGVLIDILDFYGITGMTSANAFYKGFLGNRDNPPSQGFSYTTGEPAYYDHAGAIGLKMASTATADVIDLTGNNGVSSFTAGQVVNITNGVTYVVGTISTVVTATTASTPPASATPTPRITLPLGTLATYAVSTGLAITPNLKLNTSGGGTVCTRTCAIDADGNTGNGNTLPIADPKNNDGSGTARYYAVAAATCQSTGTAGSDCSTLPAACGAPVGANAYYTAVYGGCSWTGRQSLYVEGSGTYYYGGVCGSVSTCTGGAGGASTCPASRILNTNTFGSSSYQVSNHCSTSGLANLSVNGTSMAGAVLGSATNGCSTLGNATATCPARPGGSANPAGCFYVNNGATAACTQPTVSAASGTTDYAVFNLATYDSTLVHDCLRDNNTNGNPGNGYIKANTDIPFNTSWGASYNATAAGTTAPYSVAGSAVSGGNQIDVYSVNYLNWVYGPKGPNNAPIGRKTRLQVAKDALSGIVASTNGVRFGLMVFNRTAACTAASGTINPGAAVFTGTNPGFIVGSSVAVVGAGASGANLTTTISSIAPNSTDPNQSDFTLAASTANPSTTGAIVNGGTVITVANVAGFAVGQRISVSGADPTNTPSNALIANITAINAAAKQFTLSDNAKLTVAGASVTLAQFTTTMQSNPCSGAVTNEGANVARVMKRMGNGPADLPDYNNRAALIAAINAVTAAARTPLTESIYEAYRYFSGRAPKWGTSTAVDSASNVVTLGRDTTAICTSAGPGTGCSAVGNYASPMLNNPNTTNPAGCQKNFIVLITDGGPEDDFSANADVKSLSWSGPLGIVAPRTGLDATQTDTGTNQFEVSAGVPYGPTDLAGNTFDGGYIWLDELTYFMGNADVSPGARTLPGDSGSDSITGRQSVNTYTIGFAGANSPVLQNAALRGNGVYYTADNSAALSAAIIAALAAITNWNPTVAAPTVPISALNRSENATDVYLAFFQPDPSQEWLGTVKKFQLSQYPNNGDPSICGAGVGLCLIGQTQLTKSAPNPSPTYNIETVVVDAITGISQSQVDDNATSFWGPSSLKDGSKPNQGGTGYELVNNTGTLTPETRKIYTFLTNAFSSDVNSGTSVNLTNSANQVHFNNAAVISKCRLGDTAACSGSATMSAATQETLINWIRGGDIASTASCIDGASSTCTTFRAWPHADVQHSKPVIVTYTITPSIKQYMIYLQNNGLVTAIDTATGIEKWSFMVEEALPQIQAMINDSAGTQINIADGTPSIYIEDVNSDGNINGADKVWLYFGLRRGGRAYYAIDITNPDVPVFGWKIDNSTGAAKMCVANGVCTTASQYNELGQTWSTPFIGKVRANTNPVLIFGGGYDPADDSQPVGTRTMGRAIYVVDAFSGTLVQSWGNGQSGPFLGGGAASMIYAIPSDVTALNTDLDSVGYIDRIYVGDTRANLWRIDTDNVSVGSWNAKLLATLSSDIASGERRKILFPPAVVKQNAPFRFDAVYVGTGDREHPLCLVSNQVTPTVMTNTCPVFAPADRMYMVIDPDYGLTATSASPILVSDLYARPTTDLATNTSNSILSSYKGWYRSYDNGEKTANAPTVFSQRLRFGTYAPLGQSGGSCVPPGEGRLNEIDAVTGDLVPINGAVTQASDRYYSTFITHGYISTGQLIVQGKNIYHIVVSDSRLQSVLVGSMGSATKIYWYMEPEQ
jgi:type IV pilus assembly protein PilY1